MAAGGLRERKKQMTREALVSAAEALFAQRGFDNVTVAQIAEAVHIAPKTVFVYFSTKEDLVFHGEDAMCETLVSRIRDRPRGQSPLEALTAVLAEKMSASRSGPVSDLERLLLIVGDSPTLLARMQRMWQRFEQALAVELARESGEHPSAPQPRIAAAQLITVFRSMAAPEVMTYLRSYPVSERAAAYANWLTAAAELVGNGIADYGRRP